MPTRNLSNLISFFLALTLYGIVLLLISSYLLSKFEKIDRFSSKKDDYLDIVIISKESENESKKVLEKSVQPIKKEKPIEKKVESVKKEKPVTPKANIQELFKSVDSTKLNKPDEKPKQEQKSRLQKSEVSSQEPEPKASSLVDSLEFTTAKKIHTTGTYDPYKGKISEMLDGYWQETIDTISGAQATVTIEIDRVGNFSYAIVNLSYNNAFNAKLRDFLERMRHVSFPPYAEGERMRMNVNFKDLLE